MLTGTNCADVLSLADENRLMQFHDRVSLLAKTVPLAIDDVTSDIIDGEIHAEWSVELCLPGPCAPCMVLRFGTIGDDPQKEVVKQLSRLALKAQAAISELAVRIYKARAAT